MYIISIAIGIVVTFCALYYTMALYCWRDGRRERAKQCAAGTCGYVSGCGYSDNCKVEEVI